MLCWRLLCLSLNFPEIQQRCSMLPPPVAQSPRIYGLRDTCPKFAAPSEVEANIPLRKSQLHLIMDSRQTNNKLNVHRVIRFLVERRL